jgi:hypothetical protein
MPTRILFDPRVDLPDGSTGSNPVIVEATPTAIRANGAVVIFPTTLTFTVSTAADVVQLAAPGAGQAWRLVVRRATPTRTLVQTAGSTLIQRTVTWTDAPTVTWAALTDVDPATLEPTPDTVAAWSATQALAQAALDAVNALKAGAPGALDTFLELATQLQADESGATALATLVSKKVSTWQPSTAYVAGQVVIAPDGSIVQALATFTSGASFLAANWTVLAQSVTAVATNKGDLVVGIGAGSQTRLPVGTDGYLLTADSTAAAGASWKAPVPVPYPAAVRTANYYFCSSAAAATTGAPTINQPRATPWKLDKTVNITRIGVEFTVAGDAASVLSTSTVSV